MTVIGYRIYKPVSTDEELQSYSEVADWCNTNDAYISDDGEYYEVKSQEHQEPTVEEKIARLERAVQKYMDNKVKSERGYDSVYTAITYLNSPTERFATEAKAVLEWRDAIWVLCNELLAQYKSGEIEELTADEVIEKLPALEWNTEAL